MPVDVFISYAIEDKPHLQRLETHLALLKRQDILSTWHAELLIPGQDWRAEVTQRLLSAQMIILLVSADYFSSDASYTQMERAIERSRGGKACVIPVLVRPCLRIGSRLDGLSKLPDNEVPISEWPNGDSAWQNVASGIRRAIVELGRGRTISPMTISPGEVPLHWSGSATTQSARSNGILRTPDPSATVSPTHRAVEDPRARLDARKQSIRVSLPKSLIWCGATLIGVTMLSIATWYCVHPNSQETAQPTSSQASGMTASGRTPTPTVMSTSPASESPIGSHNCPTDMAYIAGGTFRMGSAASDNDAAADEFPEHEVTLSPFCIDVSEVTVAMYRRCGENARNGIICSPPPTTVEWKGADVAKWSQFCNGGRSDRDQHPINCVTWSAAATYCKWKGATLPTEAQWEYAARGKQRRKYPWGSAAPGPRQLNACGAECRELGKNLGSKWKPMYETNDGAEATAPVKSYPAGVTSEGVFDMAGNVWEWVQDGYGSYDNAPQRDPLHEGETRYVLRGGGWLDLAPRQARAASRLNLSGDVRNLGVGFRCAQRTMAQ